MSAPQTPPPGWYSDPSGGAYQRYWDGQQWTGNTRPLQNGGQTPYTPPPSPGAPTYGGQGYGEGAYGYGASSQGTGYGYVTPPIGVHRGPVDDRPYVNDMISAVRVCIQKFAQFDGRAGRPEFWFTELALFLVTMACVVGFLIPFFGFFLVFVLWALSIAAIIPLLAVAVRRLRDAGFHWALMFIAFVPLGIIALVVLWAMPSKYP